jgi:hypothetical protein
LLNDDAGRNLLVFLRAVDCDVKTCVTQVGNRILLALANRPRRRQQPCR